MKEFECPDPKILVARGVVDAFLAAFGAYRARGEKVVKRHLGSTELSSDATATFPLGQFLAAMRELQEQFGGSFMQKVGSFIFDKAEFPPGLDTIEKVMSSVNQAYYMNHVNAAEGKIGGYHWTLGEGTKGTMSCDNPYPCAFDLGILESITARFTKASGKVVHDDTLACRNKGGDTCTYYVEW